MKLLIYSHFFSPSIGGVETAVQYLAEGLQGLSPSEGDPEFEVTVVTRTAMGSLDDSSFRFRVVRKPSVMQLWRAIRDSDVVHLAGPALLPLTLSLSVQKPVVIEHHGYQAICPNGLLVHQPDRAVCPGHFQADNYLECWRCRSCEISGLRAFLSLLLMFPRLRLSHRAAANLAISQHVLDRHVLPRSSVVYYGIADPLKDVSTSPEGLKTSGRFCFAYVGRFYQEKGIAVLLQAAALLLKEGQQFEVRLIGDGPQRPELETLIKGYGLGSVVSMTGYLSGAALADALRDVRVVAMPSLCEETAGLAAIEQMMRGRLVIAAKIGGLAEVVGDVGLTFPAGDARALADSMRMVLLNPGIVESMGHKARDRALQLFRRERMIEEHARLYKQVSTASKS